MSKASKKKHRQRRKQAKRSFSTICQQCGTVEHATPESLLNALATAMNAVDDAGLKLRLRHGIVTTRRGYVLPLKNHSLKRDSWAARSLTYSALSDMSLPLPDIDDD